MRVFLTGGTGFIGRPLTQALRRRGWSVTALVRNPHSAEAQAILALGVTLASGDVTERESMRAAMAGADLVVHNAGHYEMGVDAAGRRRMEAVNVRGTDNVLGLALELQIPRTVHVSSAIAFGDTGPCERDETFGRQSPPSTWYEHTKTVAHHIALKFQARGLPLTIVCPNGVIGADDHSAWGYFLRLYLNHVMPPLGWSPGSRFSLVDVDDLAEGVALAAERGRLGEVYALCGESLTFREHMALWALRPGSFRPLWWPPTWLAAALFAPLEPLQRAVGLPAFISRETARGAGISIAYSNAKARRELGWEPRPARTMWLKTMEGELALLRRRRTAGQGLLARLRPLGAATLSAESPAAAAQRLAI